MQKHQRVEQGHQEDAPSQTAAKCHMVRQLAPDGLMANLTKTTHPGDALYAVSSLLAFLYRWAVDTHQPPLSARQEGVREIEIGNSLTDREAEGLAWILSIAREGVDEAFEALS